MESSNIALLLLLAAGQAAIFAEGTPVTDSECENYRYMYTLQPPEAIVCSPYVGGILNLTCAVAGDLVDGIQWYFRPMDSNEAVILTNNSQVTLTPSVFDGDYSVILMIEGLNAENEGFYWCQGLVQYEDQTLQLTQSDEFQLLAANHYVLLGNCPMKSHKNSEVRCATIIFVTDPIPTTSLALPELTSEVVMSLGHSSTVEQTYFTASLTLFPTPTTSTHTTSMSVRVSPTSELTDNTSGGTSDTPPTGTQTDSTTKEPSLDPQIGTTLQLSDIILYTILALLGFLVILVLSLSIVISILCCKKRHSSLRDKAAYDQFSTESEERNGTMTLKSVDSFPLAPPPPPPYRHPLHTSHSDTMMSCSSGVYDEIHTIMSQYGTQPCMLSMLTHQYQEIPVVQVNSTGDDTSGVDTGGEACARDSALGTESEVDVPQHPSPKNPYDRPDQLASRVDSQPQPSDSTDSSEFTILPHRHGSEQPSILIEQRDALSSVDNSSEFTNSNLQVTPPPEDNINTCLAGCSDTVTLELEPKVAKDIAVELSVGESAAIAPLPVIPEHPYYVLEEKTAGGVKGCKVQSASQNGPRCDQSGVEPAPPPQILHRLSFSEDEGYDRLVGPPHIYHILQKSPSCVRPQIRECSPTSGYHRIERGVQSPQGGEQFQSPFRPQDDLLYSEESSVISSSDLFDDPQYNFSPKRTINGGPPSKSHLNGRSGQLTTLERTKMEKAIDLSKYRGDYERDPTYMKLIKKLTEASEQSDELTMEDSDHINVAPLMKDAESKSASLPDITHTYQSLQPLTRDPLRNYESLHKSQLTVDSTNV